MFSIGPTTRIRRSPFYDATVAEGVTGFAPYNSMLMPTGYGDDDAEYWRIINGVSQWDVGIERQVEITGKDAATLTQMLSARDLSTAKVGQGKYAPLCDHRGTIINDPIVLKLSENKYWLSIADSNILFWSRAIAAERGLDVEICEPDVSPLAVQGPLAEDVIASIFGNWVRDLKFFWFTETELQGIPVAVQRSGWSKQGGFEIYLCDGTKGSELWNIVREAGQPFGIGPGNPNPNERIESGLLSYGGDTDEQTNPYEVGMGRYVDTDLPDEVVGMQVLRQIAERGPKRHQLGLILDGDAAEPTHRIWYDILCKGQKVGDMTNGVWSRRLEKNIGFALIERTFTAGAAVQIVKDGQTIDAALTDLPFIGRSHG